MPGNGANKSSPPRGPQLLPPTAQTFLGEGGKAWQQVLACDVLGVWEGEPDVLPGGGTVESMTQGDFCKEQE